MSTFCDRYQFGEREQVWSELIALGDAVRQEPVYADALAVGRETMRRAQSNIETLIDRLTLSDISSRRGKALQNGVSPRWKLSAAQWRVNWGPIRLANSQPGSPTR